MSLEYKLLGPRKKNNLGGYVDLPSEALRINAFLLHFSFFCFDF